MCPREEPVCISQTGSFRMSCRIGALDGSLHGDSNLAPLRRDMPHRRHDRKRQQRMRCRQARSVVFARQDAGFDPMRWQYRHRVGRLAVQGQCEARTLGELDVRRGEDVGLRSFRIVEHRDSGVSASFAVAIASNGDQQPTTPSKPW